MRASPTSYMALEVYGPRTILRYLADALRMRASRYLGHNPAGGAMVVTLLATLLVLCATGIMLTLDAFWGVQWVDDLHGFASDFDPDQPSRSWCHPCEP